MRSLFTHTPDRCSWFAALALILTLSCNVPPEERPPEFIQGDRVWSSNSATKAADGADQRPVLNFGIGPWLSPERMEESYRPLLDYLEDRTQHRIILNITPDYSALLTDLKAGRIDVAIMSSMTFAESLGTSPDKITYLVTSTRATADGSNSPFYYGYIVTTKGSKIRTLQDLKGKRFGFVDQKSASGYRFPLASILNAGIDPQKDFSETVFLGSHDSVADALVNGRIDAGAIWDHAFDQYQRDHQAPLALVTKTSPIPEEAWVAGPSADPKVSARIKAILLNIDASSKSPSGQPIFGSHNQTTGYSSQGAGLYQVINENTRIINVYDAKGSD